MSIINSFDITSEPILCPSHLSKPIEGFPETLIVTLSRYMLNTFLQHYTCRSTGSMLDGRTMYETTYENKPIAFFRTSMGAPPTVALVEEAIAYGARKVLIFGSCGMLAGGLESIVVPTHAYRDEGTSYHYAPADVGDFIEVKTAERLSKLLEELGIPHSKGKTWSTDAVFRETLRNMELRRAAGCIVVEMECSGVMAMADFRGIEAYQFLYTTDNLDTKGWERRTLGMMPTDTKTKYAKLALDLAVRL